MRRRERVLERVARVRLARRSEPPASSPVRPVESMLTVPATEADGGRSRAASGDAAVLRASRQDIAAPCARDAKRRADTPRPPLGPPARADVCV